MKQGTCVSRSLAFSDSSCSAIVPQNLSLSISGSSDFSIQKQQLTREISCLEGQLYRLKARDETRNQSTLNTYQDMLESRKKLLESL